jgi:peptidyl-prolyl cis-trans isomerase SurA
MRLNWLLKASVLSFATVMSTMAAAQSAGRMPSNAEVPGSSEYLIAEIFLSSTPQTDAEVRANLVRVVELTRGAASFPAYARQISEGARAGAGGDLGWVRPEQLPAELAIPLRAMQIGAIEGPIAVPGGYSVIWVRDIRAQQ